MYYTGTQQQCEAYNQEVTQGENYVGGTTRWANVITHPTEDKFAIIAHEKYSSELEMLEVLTSDWITNPEI
jgi:Holliday junction resolvasome RuvABC ATP-dependent DNA helicase subunit